MATSVISFFIFLRKPLLGPYQYIKSQLSLTSQPFWSKKCLIMRIDEGLKVTQTVTFSTLKGQNYEGNIDHFAELVTYTHKKAGLRPAQFW